MNDRSAKIGVWAYLLFTLASFALALYLCWLRGIPLQRLPGRPARLDGLYRL